MLSADPDDSIRNTAFYTLETLNLYELRVVFTNPETPLPVLDFAATQLVPKRRELAEAMLENPGLPRDLREWIEAAQIQFAEQKITQAPAPIEEEAVELPGPTRETLLQKIARLSAADKIKMALTGNQEERMLLIRDSNKIVSRAVLQSPKLSDVEIESFASMKSVTEEILRLIALNRKFMKSYAVVYALANNPRTPIDVSLPLINRLNERDLKGLSINKNVPEVIRSIANKMIKQKQEASKPKLPGKH
jgi:hypothetical protein